MAVTYQFDNGTGYFTVTQKDGATELTKWQFTTKLATARVRAGRVIVRQDGVGKVELERSATEPVQIDDTAARTFLQTLLYS